MDPNELNRIAIVQEIYAALDPKHKELMKHVKRILDSDRHDEEVKFRIFMIIYHHTRISLGKANSDQYGKCITAASTESMWQEAQTLYLKLKSRKGVTV